MRECDWKEKRKYLKYETKISPLLLTHKISEKQMMKVLYKNILYGFWMVDIEPLTAANKFLHLNWPPILKKMDVQADQLPKWMNVQEMSFLGKQLFKQIFQMEEKACQVKSLEKQS